MFCLNQTFEKIAFLLLFLLLSCAIFFINEIAELSKLLDAYILFYETQDVKEDLAHLFYQRHFVELEFKSTRYQFNLESNANHFDMNIL